MFKIMAAIVLYGRWFLACIETFPKPADFKKQGKEAGYDSGNTGSSSDQQRRWGVPVDNQVTVVEQSVDRNEGGVHG